MASKQAPRRFKGFRPLVKLCEEAIAEEFKVSRRRGLGYTIAPLGICPEHKHPLDPKAPPPDRKKMVLFALMLLAISAFMYVSFIVKTAVKGP